MRISLIGFFPVVLSSIEVRYQLAATEVGAIASTFDVAVAVSVIFISYFAGYGHKPRLLGISLLTMGLGKHDMLASYLR